jgi:hypothetical protein
MQPNRPIPEFLCYKYKGVKRIDQIRANAVPFAWKCRKYQNWKAVQNRPDDKEVLLKFADAVLEKNQFPMENYGQIAEIFYNVQRWRKDNDELLPEAEIASSWAAVDSITRLISENPKVLIQKLEKDICDPHEIPASLISEFFFAKEVCEMLSSQKVQEVPTACVNYRCAEMELTTAIRALVTFMYDTAAVKTNDLGTANTTKEMLNCLYRDLGFPAPNFSQVYTPQDFSNSPVPRSVIIRYAKLDPLRLFRPVPVEGHIDLIINENHEFVRSVLKDEKAKQVLEHFLSAYAEASEKLPTQKESLDSLTSYLAAR